MLQYSTGFSYEARPAMRVVHPDASTSSVVEVQLSAGSVRYRLEAGGPLLDIPAGARIWIPGAEAVDEHAARTASPSELRGVTGTPCLVVIG